MSWSGIRFAAGVTAVLGLGVAVTTTCGDSDPTGTKERDVVLWRFRAYRGITAPLITDGQIIFAGDDGKVVAVDRIRGTERWTRQLPGNVLYGNVVLEAGGLVIVPQYELWGLAPESGIARWRFGGPDGAAGTHDPAVAADTVFAASAFGWVSKVDATTGEALWSVDLGESAFQPALSDELVIYGTRGFLGPGEREGPLGEGHIVALRRSDGSEAWRFPLPDSTGFPLSGGAVSGGVVWQDRVIVAGVSSRAYALRLADGTLLWQRASGASPRSAGYYEPPAVVGDVAVLLRDDPVVEGISAESGELAWTLERLTGISEPVTAGNFVYIISGVITIADAAGQVRWRYGGMELAFGRVFWRGSVSQDGIIYTLGNEYTAAGGPNYLWALDPPVKP